MKPLQPTASLSSPTNGAALIIEVPPKVWRPRVTSKYKPPEYADDINDKFFDCKQYGKAVLRPKTPWATKGHKDIILFDESSNNDELQKNLKIGSSVTSEVRKDPVSLVKRF